MSRLCAAAALSLSALMLTACSDTKGNPTSPEPSPGTGSATVRAVVVSATPTSATTFQMKAVAELSDGTSPDVTAAASWQVSDATLATISPAGVLTALKSGDVDVRATFQNVSGSTRVALSAGGGTPGQMYVVSGLARETPPAPKPLPGVTVQVISGPDAGRSTTSDASGAYGFSMLQAGTIGLEAHKDGYVMWRLTNLVLDHDQSIDIVMYPDPPKDNSGSTATARCNDGSWSWAPTRDEACKANGGIAYQVCPGPLCGAITASRNW